MVTHTHTQAFIHCVIEEIKTIQSRKYAFQPDRLLKLNNRLHFYSLYHELDCS